MPRHIRTITLSAILIVPALAMAQRPATTAPSPELIGQLSRQLGATNQQAMGAAGALFSLAKTRLKPAEFSKVSAAVPGMDKMLAAAPAKPPASAVPTGTSGLAQMGAAALGGKAGGMASFASAFSTLGLKPEQVAIAASVLTSYVSKSGGSGLGSLLAGVLK